MIFKKTSVKISFAFVLMLSVLISFPKVLAVGIGSTSSLNKVIDFEPGLRQTFSYVLVADAPQVMDYIAFVEGAFAQYFTLSQSRFEKLFPRTSRSFTATMKLPEEKPAAGLHETQICVETGEALGGGGGFGVKTRTCAIVGVRVLYGEKYAVIENLNVKDIDVGDILKISMTVKSWTEQDIDSVKATIDIFGPTEKGFDRKIATTETEEKSLASNDAVTLHASMGTRDFESGEYLVVATAYYDGNEDNRSTKFKVGMLAVKIVNYTQEVIRNRINKFNVDVESRWNSLIENVYADVELMNETLKTPSLILKPWERAALTTYLDATDKRAQDYDGRIILHYANTSMEQPITVKVLVNPEEIRRLVIYASVTAVVVALLVVIVVIFLKKSRQEKHATKKKKKS